MASHSHLGWGSVAFIIAAPACYAGDEAVFAQYEPTTVCLEITGQLYNGTEEVAGRGSAFFLNDQRSVLTDNHVLPDLALYKEVRIAGRVRVDDTKPDLTVALKLVGQDDKRDLALLEADAPIPSRYVIYGDSRKVKPGAHLLVLGCPLGFGPTMTAGILGNVKDEPQGRWLADTPINPGNSGGPVFTSDGALVGVAWGGIRKTAEGVPVYGLNIITPIHQAVEGMIQDKKVQMYAAPSVSTSTPGVNTASLSNFTLAPAAATATPTAVAAAAPSPSNSPSRAPSATAPPLWRSPSSAPISIGIVAVPMFTLPSLTPTPPSLSVAPSPPTSPPASSASSTAFSVNATTAPARTISRAFEIRQMKDDHPSTIPATKNYMLRFASDPGFKFASFEFGELSRNHGSPPVIEISPDAKEIHVSFSLTSGPLFDEYRGWLDGTLVTRQIRE